DRFRIDPDRLEHPYREGSQQTAAQRDEDVVDEQLTRKANEVHPGAAITPMPSRVRYPHHDPERDGQVHREKHLRVAAALEGEDVGGHRGTREREQQPTPGGTVDTPLPDEVDR